MWPSATQFSEAVQNPKTCFSDPELRSGSIAVDKLGMPFAASGQFAVVFKLRVSNQTHAIRCFTRELGDRATRYQAIDSHLDSCKSSNLCGIQCLTQFDYERDGIIVGGRKYPILIMDWIEGSTLDVYVEHVIGNKEALLNMASEWVRLIKALRDARIAHGDLQHGNIIVEPNSELKLVDFDGMFVPNMASFKACELGHIDYQHPNRDTSDFSLNLDNFSALVIYVSLLIAAHQPSLWSQFHDEGLMFKRSDFKNPARSALFRSLDGSNAQLNNLAKILRDSCRTSINSVPSLVDLVTVEAKPRLPAWMTGTTVASPTVKTREATKAEEILIAKPSVTDKPLRTTPLTTMPSPLPPQPSPTYTPVAKSAFSVKKFTKNTLFSLPGLFPLWLGVAMRASPREWFWLSLGCYLITAMIVGYILTKTRKKIEDRVRLLLVMLVLFVGPWCATVVITEVSGGKWFWLSLGCCVVLAVIIASASRIGTTAPQKTPSYRTPRTVPQKTPSYRSPVPRYPSGQTSSTATLLVGSTIRFIYHRQSCEWARKISKRHRVYFASASEARTMGFRPCKVCLP